MALILLHEMMHQACHEAGEWVDNCHQGPLWLAHCNHIGGDLGLGLTFARMKRGKTPMLDDDGVPIKNAKGEQLRANKWMPMEKKLLPNTNRTASYDECRMFPLREDDGLFKSIQSANNEKNERRLMF
jgi:hypothetical protein